MLDYLYDLVSGGHPRLTPEVQMVFLDNRELFNIGQAGDEIEVESQSHWYNPFCWGKEQTSPNLDMWLAANQDNVWAMLYGALPHNLR